MKARNYCCQTEITTGQIVIPMLSFIRETNRNRGRCLLQTAVGDNEARLLSLRGLRVNVLIL